jgi:hypothetical protein
MSFSSFPPRRIALLLLALLPCGCAPTVTGSGRVITQTRPVADFAKVSLDGTGDLIIEQTGADSLTITTDENLLPYLTSDVAQGRLSLGVKDIANLKPSAGITYRLTVKNVQAIELNGFGTVDAKGLQADPFAAAINGAGDITLAGQTGQLALAIAGSGDFHGENFPTTTATVSIAGSGNVVIAVRDKLDITVAGSGSIEYVGDPTVTQTVIGSGSVKKR